MSKNLERSRAPPLSMDEPRGGSASTKNSPFNLY